MKLRLNNLQVVMGCNLVTDQVRMNQETDHEDVKKLVKSGELDMEEIQAQKESNAQKQCL